MNQIIFSYSPFIMTEFARSLLRENLSVKQGKSSCSTVSQTNIDCKLRDLKLLIINYAS
jgi:hypothetical protein